MKKSLKKSDSIPITLLESKKWNQWSKTEHSETVAWAESCSFNGKPDTYCLVPGNDGKISRVLAGVSPTLDIWSIAGLSDRLPPGTYRLESPLSEHNAERMLLGWLLGSYRFSRYKDDGKLFPELLPPLGANYKKIRAHAEAIYMARDLINTPANDMGPAELASACAKVAKAFGAQCNEIIGEELLKKNYPAIYTVGKASERSPRLIDLRWGNPRHPKITLVGKGVCFDSGGLDIKTSSGMKLMKKDMAGAACALALAQMIMEAQLPVRLRVLIPAVENSISGNAYRPLDVIPTRKGLTIEIGNTDAEGRIILCDALFEACTEKPDLLLDFATLTGAARTALGVDIPALFTQNDKLAADVARHSIKEHDPIWRLPLWHGYRKMLDSSVADLNSAPDSPYAGAITAALYLNEFVNSSICWAHIDMMAWNLSSRPGRPEGGDIMAIRAFYAFIEERFRF